MAVGVTQGERRSKAGIGRLVVAFALLGTMLAGLPPAAAAAEKPTRYSLAGGCYALHSESADAFVAKAGGGYAATASAVGAAEPFRMQATTLGRYLFYGKGRDFLALDGDGVTAAGCAERRCRLDRARERRRVHDRERVRRASGSRSVRAAS